MQTLVADSRDFESERLSTARPSHTVCARCTRSGLRRMLWRKKKSVEPQSVGIPRASPGQTTALAMTEVYALSYSAALQRGYPGAVADAIAGRVLWLEKRGLPGVIALTREFINNKDTTPVERGTNCPFIAGTLLMDQFDLFVACDAGRQLAIAGPTNGLLILPKVADYAAQIGAPIRVSWLKGEPPEVTGEAIVGPNGAVLNHGNVSAALFNTGVAFVRDGASVPAAAPPRTSASVADDMITALISFIGRDRLDAAIKVHKLVNDDAATVALLHILNDDGRSKIHAVRDGKADEPAVLTAAPGSSNDRLWARFVAYGWTTPLKDSQIKHSPITHSDARGNGMAYRVTDEGRAILPMVLTALDRFPPTKH